MLRVISLITAGAFSILAFHALSTDHARMDGHAIAEQGHRPVDGPSDPTPSRSDSDTHLPDSVSLLARTNSLLQGPSGIPAVGYLARPGITQDMFSATDFSLPDRPNPGASILRTRSLRL